MLMNFTQMGIYAIASPKWVMVQAFTPSKSVILFLFLERFPCAPLAITSLNAGAYEPARTDLIAYEQGQINPPATSPWRQPAPFFPRVICKSHIFLTLVISFKT